MDKTKRGAIAVIFTNRRNALDEAGYARAAAAMAAEAARQPGYLGLDSVRDATGEGITISWWADEAAARAWRAHPDHATIRDRGRADWYDRYDLAVASVVRAYRWERTAPSARFPVEPQESAMSDRPTEAEDTTGEAGIAITPPERHPDIAAVPAVPDPAGTEDADMLRDTAVQGAQEE